MTPLIFIAATHNVLVVYTQAAKAAANMPLSQYTQLMVDQTNQIYVNSGIDVQVTAAHSIETDYTELNDPNQMVIDLMTPNDGKLDEVHVVRDVFEADLVVMVINSCGGRVQDILSSPETAFAWVGRIDCLSNPYAFAHEIGHLQGAHHQEPPDVTNEAFPWGHGFFGTTLHGNKVRTVMANGPSADYTRIPYFSSPTTSYEGIALGSDTQDNTRVINDTKDLIARHRSTIDRFVRVNGASITGFAPIASASAASQNACAQQCFNNLACNSADYDPATMLCRQFAAHPIFTQPSQTSVLLDKRFLIPASPTLVPNTQPPSQPLGTIQQATLTIQNGAAEDVLSATGANGITVSYAAGTLTLKGPATYAAFAPALASVRYKNTNAVTPQRQPRNIRIQLGAQTYNTTVAVPGPVQGNRI